MTGRSRRMVLAPLLVLGVLLMLPRGALAHALLLRSDPAPNSVVPSEPRVIHLWFSESIEPGVSKAIVWDVKRRMVNRSPERISRGRELSVSLKPGLPDGTYLVVWTSVSPDDGHVLQASFPFSIGHPGRQPVIPGAAGTNQDFPPSLMGLAELASRWLVLLLSAVWLGLLLFALMILPRVHESQAEAEPARFALRRANGLIAPTLMALLTASGGGLLIQANAIANGSWTDTFRSGGLSELLFDSDYGRLWVARQGMIVVALGLAMTLRARPQLLAPESTGTSRRACDIRVLSVIAPWPGTLLGGEVARQMVLVLAVAATFILAATGHASTVDFAATGAGTLSVPVLLDFAHLLAGGVWIGGIMAVVLVIVPAFGAGPSETRTKFLLDSLDRFSPYAYISVGVLAITGSFNSSVHISSWGAFLASVYGRALMLKLGLVGVIVVVSWHMVLRVRPRMRQAVTESRPAAASQRLGRLQRNLTRWLRVSACAGAGIFLAAAVMNTYPVPPALPAVAWQPAGLSGILVHSISFRHTRHTLAFVGTEQGVYRRVGLGPWRQVVAGQIWSVEAVSRSRTVLAGDQLGHVDVSRDLGKHWRRVLVDSQGIYAVYGLPGGHTILAGGGGGVYRSIDGGHHWQQTLRIGDSAV
ncbi:MAG TPA: copper resistance protein CopC, partial [Chloroflexota bacterium]|nr:copper resistance protein CopC [Chloroflexota bacterium]